VSEAHTGSGIGSAGRQVVDPSGVRPRRAAGRRLRSGERSRSRFAQGKTLPPGKDAAPRRSASPRRPTPGAVPVARGLGRRRAGE